VCQTVVNTVPVPKEKQVCRNDEKKVCELEQRAQPKQVFLSFHWVRYWANANST
jgi:arabinogalactan endo-1,4-beta-galactosidase